MRPRRPLWNPQQLSRTWQTLLASPGLSRACRFLRSFQEIPWYGSEWKACLLYTRGAKAPVHYGNQAVALQILFLGLFVPALHSV